jgi:hypothetical protein
VTRSRGRRRRRQAPCGISSSLFLASGDPPSLSNAGLELALPQRTRAGILLLRSSLLFPCAGLRLPPRLRRPPCRCPSLLPPTLARRPARRGARQLRSSSPARLSTASWLTSSSRGAPADPLLLPLLSRSSTSADRVRRRRRSTTGASGGPARRAELDPAVARQDPAAPSAALAPSVIFPVLGPVHRQQRPSPLTQEQETTVGAECSPDTNY